MAGKIKQEDIEKVRQTADLYEIVSADVQLKPSGGSRYMGLCPFHDDKSPSMSVNPASGLWHCFACGAGGDTFGYIEQRDGLDFRGAVEMLADQYHIELHYETTPGYKPQEQHSTRQRLLAANEEAQRFFTDQITHNPEAVAAHKLLDGRNFSWNDALRFGCGYAPRGWDNLVRHLSEQGFTQQEMLDAGLARRGANGSIYDYFRGRATWPIRDSTGNTLGFGARRLYDDDDKSAKYLNTPDTMLYRKNQVLYGIDLAKKNIMAKRQAVIVEGYTDVMAMHLAGVDTAVATCGTAFGEEHAKIIRRLIRDDKVGGIQLVGPQKVQGQTLSSRVVFTFDGDEAGRKAAMRAFGLDASFQTQTFVAVAQDNLDPCDLRLYHGDDAVRSLIEHACPLYDFVMETVIARFDTSYTTGQMGAVKAVAPVLAQIRDHSLYDLYIRKAAGLIGVDVDVMRREANRERSRQHVYDEDAYASRERGNAQRYAQPSQSQQRVAQLRRERANVERQRYFRVDDQVFMTEQQFMALLLQVPTALDATRFAHITVDSFTVPAFRRVFQALVMAGGMPTADTRLDAWLAHIRDVAGPVVARVIDELVSLDIPVQSDDRTIRRGEHQEVAPKTGIRQPTEAERRVMDGLATKLIDLGYLGRIADLQTQLEAMPEGEQKMALFQTVMQLERERNEMRNQALSR